MKQTGFASAEYAGKKKTTRRERFLGEMNAVVPWSRLEALIEPHYPKSGKVGRPPIGVPRMLRMYFLQPWYPLADETLEDALYDSQAMREFKRRRRRYRPSWSTRSTSSRACSVTARSATAFNAARRCPSMRPASARTKVFMALRAGRSARWVGENSAWDLLQRSA